MSQCCPATCKTIFLATVWFMAKVIKAENTGTRPAATGTVVTGTRPAATGNTVTEALPTPRLKTPGSEATSAARPKTSVGRPAGIPEGEARAILARAQQEARALLQAVEDEVAQAVAAAREQGQSDGMAETRDLRAEIERLAESLQRDVEPEAVTAALQIARRVYLREIDQHPEAIVDVVRQAVLGSRQMREIFIRVHPTHVEPLRAHRRVIVDVLGRAKDIDIREDADVDRGGCVIETELGSIDARIETQFAELTRQLRGSK